jgi:hypothetical protein
LGLHIPQLSFSKCRCLSSGLELLAEYWIICKRWTLAQVAQVLITAMLNFCVVVSTDPSLLHNTIHFKWSEETAWSSHFTTSFLLPCFISAFYMHSWLVPDIYFLFLLIGNKTKCLLFIQNCCLWFSNNSRVSKPGVCPWEKKRILATKLFK